MRRCALLASAPLLLCCGGAAETPRRTFDSDALECSARLREIHQALADLARERGWQPTGSGVAFFAELVASGFWPDTAESRARLSCPGVHALPPGARSFADLAALGEEDSAYAGRDLAAFPLARFPTSGQEILMACDNAQGMNHDGVMNALYADGSVKTFSLREELEAGKLAAGAASIPVGPDSPLEDLRKLRR